MAFYMEEMTVRDMHEAMEQTKTVIIPVGVVEQHGYHLPLSTDIHNAVQVPRLAGDRLNAVVAPSVNYCFSGGELLGTVNVSPNTVGLFITEICEEFVRMGFLNIIVLLGHGGTENKDALQSTLQMLLRRNKELAEKISISIIDVFDFSVTATDITNMEPEHDFHAGMAETALMMHWIPDLVRDEIAQDDEETCRMMRQDCDWFAKHEKIIDHPFIVDKVSQRPEIKVGVMGFPERATKELGEKISNEMVDGLVNYVNMLQEKISNMI